MKRILIVLSFLILITMTSCNTTTSTTHLGDWYLTEVSSEYNGNTVTIKGGDPLFKPNEIPVSFIVTDDTTDLKITNYYGNDAKDIKVGDKLLIRVTVIKMEGSITFSNPVKVDKTNETIKTLEQIKQEAEEIVIPEGRWFIQFEAYTECTVKEITDPYVMKYRPDTLAVLTLNSDGTGTFRTYLIEDILPGSEYGLYNLTWVRYGDTIKITMMGETGVGTLEGNHFTLEQNSSINGINVKETSSFIR